MISKLNATAAASGRCPARDRDDVMTVVARHLAWADGFRYKKAWPAAQSPTLRPLPLTGLLPSAVCGLPSGPATCWT